MKKVLASLIVLSFASSVMAATYTENLVNKAVAPIAQKEAQLKAKHDAALKEQKAKQEAAKKAQEQRQKELEAKKKANQERVDKKKKEVNTVKKDVQNLLKF